MTKTERARLLRKTPEQLVALLEDVLLTQGEFSALQVLVLPVLNHRDSEPGEFGSTHKARAALEKLSASLTHPLRS